MMNLYNIFSSYKVFVDTSSLMDKSTKKIFEILLPRYLGYYQSKLIIPQNVIKELEIKSKSRENEVNNKAKIGLKIIKEYQSVNYIDIRGEKGDQFPDNLFLMLFTKFRLEYNLCLITQDMNLAMDVYALKSNKSVNRMKEIKVLYLENGYTIKDWKERIENNVFAPSSKFTHPATHNTPINVKFLPDVGDTIFAGKVRNELILKEEIGQGGEGIVYKCSNNQVCKILYKDKITKEFFDKIRLMTSKSFKRKSICWPKTIVYNEDGITVGYIMNMAKGTPLKNAIFIPPVFKKRYPNWTRTHLVKLCISILINVIDLHRRNIIIGDINPANILMKNEREVYFVDVDSYQVEQYACPVGTVNFTPPDVVGLNYSKFFRTPEHENFALAVLIFMILLPGKSPYSHRGGSNIISAAKSANFTYPLGEWNTESVPCGSWRFIWSNLPYKVKEAFHSSTLAIINITI